MFDDYSRYTELILSSVKKNNIVSQFIDDLPFDIYYQAMNNIYSNNPNNLQVRVINNSYLIIDTVSNTNTIVYADSIIEAAEKYINRFADDCIINKTTYYYQKNSDKEVIVIKKTQVTKDVQSWLYMYSNTVTEEIKKTICRIAKIDS